MLKNTNNFKIIHSVFLLLGRELFRPPSYKELMEPLDIHVQILVRHWNPGLQQLLQPATPTSPSGCRSLYKYTREALGMHTLRRSSVFFTFHQITYQLRKYNTLTHQTYPSHLCLVLPTCLSPLLSQQPDSVVGITSKVRGSNPGRSKRCFSTQTRTDCLWGPPSLLFSG
jgi:hypothetical protein